MPLAANNEANERAKATVVPTALSLRLPQAVNGAKTIPIPPRIPPGTMVAPLIYFDVSILFSMRKINGHSLCEFHFLKEG